MRVVSNKAIVRHSLLAALVSISLVSQLCVSGCAVGPSYRAPATTLDGFHSAAALKARPTSAPAPALAGRSPRGRRAAPAHHRSERSGDPDPSVSGEPNRPDRQPPARIQPQPVNLRCRSRRKLGAGSVRRSAPRQRGRVGRGGRRDRSAGGHADLRDGGCCGRLPAHPGRSGAYCRRRATGRHR